MNQPAKSHGQRGLTLLVSLIMMIMLTLLTVSAIRLSTLNKLIAGNEQYQMEAEDAAAYEIDRIISSGNFLTASLNARRPLVAFQAVGGGAADELTESNSYRVSIPTPTCRRYRYILNSELVNPTTGFPKSPRDAVCIGVMGTEITQVSSAAMGDNSLCATALWEIDANVQVDGTGANVNMRQGIEMRLDFAEARDLCE